MDNTNDAKAGMANTLAIFLDFKEDTFAEAGNSLRA